MTKPELFDYGGIHVPASFEVAWYEVEEEELLRTDWRQRAAEHFREVEAGGSAQSRNAAIGALSLGLSQESAQRQRTDGINNLEMMLQFEHNGPND